jgi:hypothetical protein
MTPDEQVIDRFQFHPALTEAKKSEHAAIRTLHGTMATALLEFLPDCRERSLALTSLQESLMWSTACAAYVMP